MLRSLMTGVTGIRAHQTMLDVVGNNVANVNTTGFKRSMTVFQDLLYQTTRGATSPGEGRGGINPMQVGLGVQVAGIEMVYSAGPLQYTGNRTDMAISGDGMFVFADGESKIYSRAGNFTQDANGKLVHVGTGYRVQGFKMTQDPLNPMNYIRSSQLSDVEIKVGSKMEARQTSVVGMRCNLDSRVGTYLPVGAKSITDALIKMDGDEYTVNTEMGESFFNIKATDLPKGDTGTITGISGYPKTITVSDAAVATVTDTFTVSASYTQGQVTFTFKGTDPTSSQNVQAKFNVSYQNGNLVLTAPTPANPAGLTIKGTNVVTAITYAGTPDFDITVANSTPVAAFPLPVFNSIGYTPDAMRFTLSDGTNVVMTYDPNTTVGAVTGPGLQVTVGGTTTPLLTPLVNGEIALPFDISSAFPAASVWGAVGAVQLMPTASGLGFGVHAAPNATGTSEVVNITSRLTTGKDFLKYTFQDEARNTYEIAFNLLDVKSGVPTLEVGNVGLPIGMTVVYDDKTGAVQIKKNGATMWETNVKSGMNYSAIQIKDASGPTTYQAIAEFDYTNLDSSPVPVTIWMSDGKTPNSVSKVKIMVPIKTDGTFDIPEDGLDIGVVDPTVTPLVSTGFPMPWSGADKIKIMPAAKGYGFEISAFDGISTMQTAKGLVQQDMTAVHSTKLDIYDCQGGAHTLEVQYKKIGDNLWRWEAFFPNEPELFPVPPSGLMEFGPCGKLVSPDSVEIEIPFSLVGSQNETITLDFSGRTFGYDAEDVEGVTQYGSPTTTKAYYQDGYTMGTMTDFSAGKDGTISGIYSNGKVIPLYRMAMATFANVNGLERVGDTMFRESANSGMAQIGVPLEGGAGSINGGNLEMSNVDISEEFTRLILAQRGFQANARVVTTSDGILEEVVNLKR